MAPPPIEVGGDDEVKGDMTPMIDIIFLLLIFFILTTKFISPEKVISALLPTNKGQAPIQQKVVEQLDDVNVCVFPELPAALHQAQPSGLDEYWNANVAQLRRSAVIRVGPQGQHIVIEGKNLNVKDADTTNAEVEKVTAYISQELGRRDNKSGPRNEQPAVVIHCFSGLPWMYALVAYDAVRSYEAQYGMGSSKYGGRLTTEELKSAREVDFAPPRIRNYHSWQLGNELWEIIRMK